MAGARAAVLVVPAAIYVLSYVHRIAPAVVATDLMQAFAITAASLGALAAIYPYVFVVMAFVGGSLVETLGPRLPLTTGATTMAVDESSDLATDPRGSRRVRDAHYLARLVGCPLPHPGLRARAGRGGEHDRVARRRHRRGCAPGRMALGPAARPPEAPARRLHRALRRVLARARRPERSARPRDAARPALPLHGADRERPDPRLVVRPRGEQPRARRDRHRHLQRAHLPGPGTAPVADGSDPGREVGGPRSRGCADLS